MRAEPDPALVDAGADLDVGNLGHGHPETPAPAVGQPQHALAPVQRRLDLAQQLVPVGILRHLDLYLAGRLADTDADFHSLAPLVLALGCGAWVVALGLWRL